MDEVLEALERLKNAPSFMGGTVEYQSCTNSETPLMQDYEIVRNAILELKSIKETNPSEALECLEKVSDYLNNVYDYKEIKEEVKKDIDTIKQALLNAQEPKHYLKWEDLVFTVDWKVMTVKMGDTVYKILYRYCYANEEVQLLSEDNKLLCLRLIGKYKYNIQFFNDLHLEVVE